LYKHILINKNLNSTKFHDELHKANIIPSDINYSIHSSLEEDKVWIIFDDIREIEVPILDEDGIQTDVEVKYQKKEIVKKTIIEQEEVIKEIEVSEIVEESDEIVEDEIIIEDDVDTTNTEEVEEIISEESTESEDEETIEESTATTTEVVEYIDVEREIEVEEWHDFDATQMLQTIESIVENHDPILIVQKTKEELLEEKVAELETLIDSLAEATWEITENLYPKI
jgi:hypothetical protein